MKSHIVRLVFSTMLYALCAMPVAAQFYSDVTFVGSVHTGGYHAISGISAAVTNGGYYTNAVAHTNYYRLCGTNGGGRIPLSTNIVVAFIGSSSNNAVLLSWIRSPGIFRHVVEKSYDLGASWTNYLTVAPGTTTWLDTGSNVWTASVFTNDIAPISPSTYPWATAAQGETADTAVQPAALGAYAGTGTVATLQSGFTSHTGGVGVAVHGLGSISTHPVEDFVLEGASNAHFATATVGTLTASNTIGPLGNWNRTGLSETTMDWLGVACSRDGTKVVAVSVYGGRTIYSLNSGKTWTVSTNDDWGSVACTEDGSTVVAGAGTGYIYISADFGATWTPSASIQSWSAITCSSNGTKIAATTESGKIWVSGDSGSNWTAVCTNGYWTGIASSADGSRLIATMYMGPPVLRTMWMSTDYGATWIANTNSPDEGWSKIACSSDGTKWITGQSGVGPLYVSTNSGLNWSVILTNEVSWSGVGCSADGSALAAAGRASRRYLSLDGGSTWSISGNEDEVDYSAFALSSDGSKMFASALSGYLWKIRRSVTHDFYVEGFEMDVDSLSVNGAPVLTSAIGKSGIYTNGIGGASTTTVWVVNGQITDWITAP